MSKRVVAFLDLLLGRRLPSGDEETERVGVFAGIPMLGLDALSSAAYGPEAALTILLPVGAAGLAHFQLINGIIVLLLAILFFSYRQTINAYPNGGGSYTVASENLGRNLGLFAAAALLVDYVLTVSVGISAGVGALISAMPRLNHQMLPLCLLILLVVTIVNLRGVRESGVTWAIPTYLFILTLGGTILWGVAKTVMAGGHPAPVIPPPAVEKGTEAVTLWLLMKAFASGCTAMTGVEAVSNGVGAFARPTVAHAQKTLGTICAILAFMLVGIAYLCHAYHIGATPPDGPGYQSVISQLVGAVAGKNWFYYITIAGVLSVLALSANTGFADFPRLCRMLAHDGFLPGGFAGRGRRLVFSLGIIILAIFSAILLIAFGGVTDRLIPLFAVGAFLAFTLSQAGMVVHWIKNGGPGAHAFKFVNGLGAISTAIALVVIILAKFAEGAWITILLIPGLVLLFHGIRHHYDRVERETTGQLNKVKGASAPPVLIVPIRNWSSVAENAMDFALTISPDVYVIHVGVGEDSIQDLNTQWERYVVGPLTEAGRPIPHLEAASSPYRRLISPLLDHIRTIAQRYPDRYIAVVIPELVVNKWWENLLHNQRAQALKAALLFLGDKRVVTINVPWYLK
jgi:amino acid transporter